MRARRLVAAALAAAGLLLAWRVHALFHAAAGMNAKILCSAVFVSGRSLDEARAASLAFEPPGSSIRLEREAGRVEVEVAGWIRRAAVFAGDQGCVALPAGVRELAFTPVAVRSRLPPAETEPWPMGDRLPEEPARGVDARGLARAADLAFAAAGDHTAAFLVVHRGRIVAERYATGSDRDSQLESWSMGKSLGATLIGRLVQQGALRLDQPAPVAEWQSPGDPRAAITVADLLRMSSGLDFAGPTQSLLRMLVAGVPDHLRIYTGMDDVFGFAIASAPQHPPNRVGRYRNADPLVLGAIVRRTVEARGEDYLGFPQRALFDRIGIRRQVLETDLRGNFILTGFDYGTARSWARLGLLYLENGVWRGERLLPEGFVRFVATPAPAWREPVYGGSFWLNGTGRYALPPDAFYMAGHGVQRVFVVPSHQLVIVRLGHTRGGATAEVHLNRALAAVLEAVAPAP